MKYPYVFLAGALSLATTRLAHAQQPFVVASGTATASIYAQRQIELVAPFEASYSGFEAGIRLPEVTAGRWSAPRLWTDYRRAGTGTPVTGMIGIHTHVLPNGKVLSWEGHNDDVHNQPGAGIILSHAYEWNSNPAARFGNLTYPNVYMHFDNASSNIFCSGHTFLANGQLLVAGGHYSSGVVIRTAIFPNTDPMTNPINILGDPDYIPPGAGDVAGYIGLRDANSFNYAGNMTMGSNYVWQNQVPMKYRRWYPTNTTLNNGDVLVIAGQRYGGPIGTNIGVQAEIPEVYDAATGTWRELTGATRRVPAYPWMFLAPDGRVFNAGPNVRTAFLNTAGTGSWTDGPIHPNSNTQPTNYDYTERNYGTAVMYQPGKILMLGGGPATAHLIDLNLVNPQWQPAASMAFPVRSHINATLLADGGVLVTGGTRANTSSDADAVLPVELWQPGNKLNRGGTWTTMNAMTVPRLYHSTAVLLPDATVLSAGGGQGGNFQDHPDYEIFTPPYLCKGRGRPQIRLAPTAVAYGQTFTVSSFEAANIVRATWVRLSSVTHSINMNQRFLDLYPTYDTTQPGQLTITAPNSANLCPPGHYMLFLIDNYGTPSVASIMAINPTACANTLSITQSVVSDTGCDKVVRLTAGGGGSGPYTWTVNGITSGQTGAAIDLDVNAYAPALQVQVKQTGECGAGTTFNTFFPNCIYTSRPATDKP